MPTVEKCSTEVLGKCEVSKQRRERLVMFWAVKAEEGDRQESRLHIAWPRGALCERDTSAYEISRKQ